MTKGYQRPVEEFQRDKRRKALSRHTPQSSSEAPCVVQDTLGCPERGIREVGKEAAAGLQADRAGTMSVLMT